MSIKISIIIPVYNVEDYLRQCLDSVVNQTLKDIEIICINDGSTDGSLAILNEYASKDSRILVVDKKNEGVSVARNRGLEVARGEYVQFVDGDDWLALDCCEAAYNEAHSKNADLLMFGACTHYSETNRMAYWNNQLIKGSRSFEMTSLTSQLFEHFTGVVWNKLYKTAKVKTIRFPVNIKNNEDGIFNAKYLLLLTRLHTLDKIGYNYRRNRPDSAMNKIMRCLINDFAALRYMVNSNFYTGLTDDYKKFVLNKHIRGVVFHFERSKKFITHQIIIRLAKIYLNVRFEKKFLKQLDAYKRLKTVIRQHSFVKYVLERVIGIKNSKDKKYKIIRILGFRFRVKRCKT